jgi:hypothetical protein
METFSMPARSPPSCADDGRPDGMNEGRMRSATAHTTPDGDYAFVRTLVVEASESDPSRLGVPAPMD